MNSSHGHLAMSHDAQQGEVLCPLCKAIANTVIPHYKTDESIPSASQSPEGGLSLIQNYDNFACALRARNDAQMKPSSNGELSVREFALAESCLTKSELRWRQTTPTPPMHSTIGHMRVMQAAWSAAAYTLLATMSSTTGADIVDKTSGGVDADRTVIEQMLRFISRARNWLDATLLDYDRDIVDVLHQLLIPSGKEFKDVHGPSLQFLRFSPLPVVVDHYSPTDKIGVALFAVPASSANDRRSAAWPILHQPILSQDLHVVAIAAVCSANDIVVAQTYVKLLCIARLTQIMIEPICTGRIDAKCVLANIRAAQEVEISETAESVKKRVRDCFEMSEGSSTSHVSDWNGPPEPHSVFADGALERFRDHACIAANVPIHPCPTIEPPSGTSLETIVLDSWLPYLEYASYLLDAFMGRRDTSTFTSTSISSSQVSPVTVRVCSLLEKLGLNEIRDCKDGDFIGMPKLAPLESNVVVNLVTDWGKMFATYYADLSVTNTSCVESAAGVQGRPRGFTCNDEDLVREPDDEDDEAIALATTATRGGNVSDQLSDGASDDDQGIELEDAILVGDMTGEGDFGDDFDEDGGGINDDDDEDGIEDDYDIGDGDGDTPNAGGEYNDDEDEEGIDEEGIIEQIINAGEGVLPPQIANWLLQMGVSENAIRSLPGGRQGSAVNFTPWTLHGVDPDLTPYTSSNMPTLPGDDSAVSLPYPPLVGSISGSMAVHVTGEAYDRDIMRTQLIDLSHLGLGRRHRIGLIELPRVFTELYKQVCLFSIIYISSL